MLKNIIIGGGFAGSVIAERIANVLKQKVLVIEKRKHIGGNCYDYRDENGIIIHKYGPHLFHTDYKEVFDYLSNFTKWREYHHKVLAYVDGKKIPIPFNLNSVSMVFEKDLAQRIRTKLIDKYGYNTKIPVLNLIKEEDEDLKILANYVYEKIFKNYTAKQWGKKPEEISFEVTSRVPVIVTERDGYFTDKYQFVPEEGYTKIFERMLENKNIEIILNKSFKEFIKIDFETKKIYFEGKEFKGKLIFTGMIDELFEYRYGVLAYRSLELEFETLDKEYFQEVAVVNYPNDYKFTRITEFKHIHPIKTPKTTILKEYPKSYEKDKDIPYYPVFDKRSIEQYQRYQKEAEKFDNIILLGRLAEYRYYDMDDVVKRAYEVFEKEIKNE